MTNLESQNDASVIFKKYKTLGLISTHIGHVTRFHQRHGKNYVILAVGDSFQSYNCEKLGLCQTSNPCPSHIECIAADSYYVYVGCESDIYIYKGGKQVIRVLNGHEHKVQFILPFGKHLVSVDSCNNVMVWHILSGQLYLSVELNKSFEITALLHPSTYVNKLVFGSNTGILQLWNISKGKMLAEFSHWKGTAITALQQSTAVDVIGVGTETGDIVLFNLRFNITIMKLHNDYGPVTCISFRMDGHEHMAIGTVMGHICMWDLSEKASIGIIEHGHGKAVEALTFLPRQPLLLSNSSDNAIKMWAFDKGTSAGRLLRERSGHGGPSTKVKFYNDAAILSAGCDSTVKLFSCEHVSADKPLGKAMYKNSVLPTICDLHMNDVREGQWDGAVAYHYRHPVVTTWNIVKGRMGSHKIVHDRFRSKDLHKLKVKNHYVSSVFLTSCGNFCLIGHSTGHMDLHNVQSGMFRGSFVDESNCPSKAHRCNVTGVAVDSLNQIVVSTSSDNNMKFWKFKTKTKFRINKMDQAASFIRLQNETDMVAVILDDFSFVVVDISSQKIVRTFSGHSGAIVDCCWTTDGKWILTTGNDCSICVWDVPTGCLINRMAVDSIATSLSISPNSNLLVTAHVEETGICLWTNTTFTKPVSLHALSDNVTKVEPIATVENDLITLSKWPVAKWLGLMSSDIIRSRNKPIAPPKAPVNAPFFLPSLLFTEIGEQKDKQLPQANTFTSKFVQILEDYEHGRADSNSVFTFLEKLQPSTVEFEMQNLIDWHGSVSNILIFLKFLQDCLAKKKYFEIVNSYLGLLLKQHAETLSTNEELLMHLEEILSIVELERAKLTGLFNQNLSIVNYIRMALL